MIREITSRRARRLLGESLREIGVLIAVFGPLDAGFQFGATGGELAAWTACIGVLMLGVGILIEVTHEDQAA